MNHPTRDEIALYVMGAHEDISFPSIERHMIACDQCAKHLQEEARLELALPQVASAQSACFVCGALARSPFCERCKTPLQLRGYRLEQVLDQRPGSKVYLAHSEQGKAVQIKELRFSQAPSTDSIKAFDREVELLKQLDHPGVPRLIESFSEHVEGDLCQYLVEEAIDGETLSVRMERKRFTEDEVQDLTLKTLEILVYLQSLSPEIYHRDIRPQNLVWRKNGQVVLINFSAARDLGVTSSFSLVGLTGYIPPEQHMGITDRTADLYALGATLTHLLTRRPPGRDETPLARANISPTFRSFVERLMVKKPAMRFASAQEAKRALLFPAAPTASPAQAASKAPSKAPSWVLALAAAAAVGGAYAAGSSGLLSPPGEPTPPPPPPRQGQVTLTSMPQGAEIYLDGAPMQLEGGQIARTPADIAMLDYGKRYTIELRKRGYQEVQRTVEMGPSADGSKLQLELQPLEGTLVVVLASPKRHQARFLIDGEERGLGSSLSLKFKGGSVAQVSGEVRGYRCSKGTVQIEPGETTRYELRCFKRLVPDSKAIVVQETRRSSPPPSSPSPPPSKGTSGCETYPDKPAGYVTISTKPYSEIFWGDQSLGTTPIAKHKLPSGCLRLRAVNKREGKQKSFKIRVEPNTVSLFRFKL